MSAKHRRSLRVELLESRQCLAASLTGINVNATDPFTTFDKLTIAGSYAYFVASTPTTSPALWRTDGTSQGTISLARVSSTTILASHQGQLYFVGSSSATGQELWRTDGTVAGTALVKDLTPGSASSALADFTSHGNLLLFTNRGDLYRSDGTAGGTDKVVDILPGRGDAVANLVSTASALYFTASDGASQFNLWKTDGTKAGTSRISQVSAGLFSSLTSVSGQLFFNRSNQLTRLTESTGQTSSVNMAARELTNVGGTLFFASQSRLYTSDGTAAGTTLVKDLYYNVSSLANFQGILYFAGGGSQSEFGNELWRSDGSPGGTFMLKDIDPTVIDDVTGTTRGSSNPSRFTPWNGRLAFLTSGDISPGISGLWVTDGTAAGTQQLNAGAYDALAAGGSWLAYSIPPNAGPSKRLFVRDGDGPAREIVAAGAGSSSSSATPIELNGQLYLAADDGLRGRELFRLNPDNSLSLVADVIPGPESSNVTSLTKANGLLYFIAQRPGVSGVNGLALFRSDGTTAGTFQLMDLTRSLDLPMFELGNQAYFAAERSFLGKELYKTDGTVAGTVLVKDIDPRYIATPSSSFGYSSSPRDFRAFNGQLYFSASKSGDRELWRSDGTAAGTQLAVDLFPGAQNSSEVRTLAVFNGRLILGANGSTGWRLLASNGTAAGTVTLATGFQAITQAVEANGALYFVGTTAAAGEELWKLPATGPAVLVKDIHPAGSSSPSQLTSANGKLYFTANDGTHGVELWQSDGTSAGTVQVRDTLPGSGSSNPTILGSLNGALFFAANDDGTTGRELWQTNGSVSGARLVRDLVPGPASSDPSPMVIVGQAAYFSGLIPSKGRELWKLRAAIPTMTLPATAAQTFTGDGPVRLAPQGRVDDPDSPVFWGARLTASLGRTHRPGERLMLASTSTVSLSGSRVLVKGIAVGRLVSSAGGRDLDVLFTQNATRTAVGEVLRAVAFNSTSSSPPVGTRLIRFDLTDGEGGIATHRAVRLNVGAASATG